MMTHDGGGCWHLCRSSTRWTMDGVRQWAQRSRLDRPWMRHTLPSWYTRSCTVGAWNCGDHQPAEERRRAEPNLPNRFRSS
jgi:hypothetical protein